ncbi:NADH-ubiquinone oxidoreductase 21 kDa subunit, mitochondrial [Golovinomyces cichoracearum]|uniref:NADH dehydrogenase [ubiquinone] iron-sulfur protein 4, mitochondrial n=1 Tax=Golovinomyces cichoracearum TaxID=62708 RepID=A0A420IQS4_9PEZI|nr:NADH-ubiquinone oxidoreductase 21 kDa subunit, mitochondrial [Golovinomyces cichoracearum]
MSQLHIQTALQICRTKFLFNKRRLLGSVLCRTISDSRGSRPPSTMISKSLINALDSGGVKVQLSSPNFSAEVDQASSQFSPTTKRLVTGSQESENDTAAVASGAPIELQARTVRIYRPVKPATQSGEWHGHHWRMDWDILSKGHRWENLLMGWQSSADFMQGTHLTFKTKEEAINFAEKQGYEYIVQESNLRKITPKAYANNFLWSEKKLKHIRTK